MTQYLESIAYAGKKPWHGLGVEVSPDSTPSEMIVVAGLDWTVEKRPLYYDGVDIKTLLEVPGKKALVRCSDNKVLSIVGSSYEPVQNHEAFDFFDQFVKAGRMEMHTAGSLWGGRYVWALAKVCKGFTLGKNDAVESFLLLMSPHVFGKALLIQYTPVRVVCWNTLNFALGQSLIGSPGAVRVEHRTAFDQDVKERAALALNLVTEQSNRMEMIASHLSKKKITPDQMEDYFCTVLQFDRARASRNMDGSLREPRQLAMFREALFRAPGQDMLSARGTWWGALNAVTYVVDHVAGRDRETALKNAWVGRQAELKRRAFAVAMRAAA